MAVEVIVTDRKVFNQYGNGLNYAINPLDFTSYLRGGVMGVQKIVYTVEIDWKDSFVNSDGDKWSVDGNKLTRQVGSWIDEGFSIGDTIDLFLGLAVVNIFSDRVITNITDTLIFFDGAAIGATSSDILGLLAGGKTDLFGLEYSYGIIENNGVIDEYRYILDDSDQTFYADNIGIGSPRDTGFVTMQSKSESNKGWNTSRDGNTKVRFVDRPSTYIQRFEIEHEYIINPYILPELLTGNKSLKYISKFDFRQNVNNVNTAKVQVDQLQQGSVGDFNENYNGYVNDFSISDLVYTDVPTLSTATELNIKSKTRIEFNVNSSSGLFTTGDPLIALHSFIPDVDGYTKQPDVFRDVWVFESVRTAIDAAFNIQGIFTKFESTLVNANQTSVLIEIEFGVNEQERLEEGNPYKLAIEVGDGDTSNQTQNVTLLIDENTYTSDNNIQDLIISDEFGFNPYYKFISPVVDLFTTYYGWVEDEIVSYHRFGVNRSAPKDASILNAFFKLVAYEDATGETFDLQSEQLDLSGVLISPPNTVNSNPFNIQLIEDDRRRGYRLRNGDEFNLLLFETKDNDGTYQFYEWRVGFKMNWQSWIALTDADTIFINTSDSFNGLNNRASNYSLKQGWSIRVQWKFDMQGLDDDGNQGETEYNFFTDQFSIIDFNEQDNIPTIWDCEISTFDENSNNLGGAILNEEYTFVKSIFTPTPPFIIHDIVPYWGEIRIAEENQQGFNNDILSTTKPYLDNNRLIPLDGDNFAKISLISNTIEVECRVDFNQLKNNINYKLSARLANQEEPIPPFQWIFKTNINIPTDGNFDPRVVAVAGEEVTWNFIDGSFETINELNISDRSNLTPNELNGTCQNVTVTFSTNNPENITELYLGNFDNNVRLCEGIDFSIFTNTNTFDIGSSNVTSVIFPSANNNLQSFFCNLNNLITTIDFTPFGNNFSGNIQMAQCPLLQSVTFPSSSGTFVRFTFNNNDIQGALDLSMLSNLGSEIRFDSNNITSVNFPTSSALINRLEFGDNSSLANADLTSLSNINGRIGFAECSLTNISFHPNTKFGSGANAFTVNFNNLNFVDFSVITANNDNVDIRLRFNNISSVNVDQVIIDLNNKGWINGILEIQNQSPSAPPTAGSAAALNNLTNVLGWTVTTD